MYDDNRTRNLYEADEPGPDRRLPLGMLILAAIILWLNHYMATQTDSYAPMLTPMGAGLLLVSIGGLINPWVTAGRNPEYQHRVPKSCRWIASILFVVGFAIGFYILFAVYEPPLHIPAQPPVVSR